MPTNWNNTFFPEVKLTAKVKRGTWKHHFRGCAREYVGYLESQALRNADRFVYVQNKTAAKKTHGKIYVRAGKGYSVDMIEKVRRLLREKFIISDEFGMAPDGVLRRGIVVAPHDALCKCYTKVCRYEGRILPATWAESPGMAPIWVPDEEGINLDLETAFTVRKVGSGSVLHSPPGRRRVGSGSVAGTGQKPKNSGSGSGSGSGSSVDEILGNESDSQTPPEISEANSSKVRRLILVSECEPEEPVERNEPAEPEPGAQNVDHANAGEGQRQTQEDPQEKPDDLPPSSSSLTHQDHDFETVSQHFEKIYYAAPRELRALWLVTDGDLAPLPTGDSYYELDRAVSSAVKRHADETLIFEVGREKLGSIMNTAIGILGKKAPKPFFKIMRQFKEMGGPVRLRPDKPALPAAPPECFAPENLPEKLEGKWDVKFDSFREAWQKLHALLEQSGDKPANVLEWRDYYYDRDAIEPKLPAPWRQTVTPEGSLSEEEQPHDGQSTIPNASKS